MENENVKIRWKIRYIWMKVEQSFTCVMAETDKQMKIDLS